MAEVRRELQKKVISARGKDVDVQTAHTIVGGRHVFYVRCVHENVVHESTLTVGAEDGPRPAEFDAAALQKQLDEFREYHANECAWKHHLEGIATQVQ